MDSEQVEYRGILRWLLWFSLITWVIYGICRSWPAFLGLESGYSLALFFGVVKLEKDKKGIAKKSYRLIVDWKDWVGLASLIAVVYAVVKGIDPIVLIRNVIEMIQN